MFKESSSLSHFLVQRFFVIQKVKDPFNLPLKEKEKGVLHEFGVPATLRKDTIRLTKRQDTTKKKKKKKDFITKNLSKAVYIMAKEITIKFTFFNHYYRTSVVTTRDTEGEASPKIFRLVVE